MSQTHHQYNKRKQALRLMKKIMLDKGYVFNKQIKNTIVFKHGETGEKVRKILVY
jgi:hypothetical protein